MLGKLLGLVPIVIGFVLSPAGASPAYTSLSRVSMTTARENNVEFILPSSANPMGCSATNFFRIQSSAANYQSIVSTILSAIARGKSIAVWAAACDTDGYSLFTAVQVPE